MPVTPVPRRAARASGSRTSSASTRTSRRSARPRRSCGRARGSSSRPTTRPARARPSPTRGERGAAAVLSPRAAALFGLEVLADEIGDLPDNRTRFLVLGRPGEAAGPAAGRRRSPHRRTTIVVAVRNEPGTLLAVLRVIADHGLNMRKLESRPSRERAWEYVFWIDLDGDAADPAMAAALDGLGRVTTMVRRARQLPDRRALARRRAQGVARSRSCRPCSAWRRPRSPPCRTGRSSPRRPAPPSGTASLIRQTTNATIDERRSAS